MLAQNLMAYGFSLVTALVLASDMAAGVDPTFWSELMNEFTESSREIATQMGAEFRQVDGGHYLHHEHPEVVAAAIKEGIKRVRK